MPVDLGTLTRVDPGQFGAVGGRDRRADRTVALSYTGALTQTACWEGRSQVCDEIRLALAEVRRRTPSAEPAWGPRGTTPRLTVRGTAAGAPPPPPPPGPPPSLPWTPSPLCSNSLENQGSRNVFSFGPIFPSRAFGAPIAGFFGHSTGSFPSVADTMSQRPISAFFSTPVQPCPRAKRDDVVNAILYFCFQDRWAGKKRQEAYNVARGTESMFHTFSEHSNGNSA